MASRTGRKSPKVIPAVLTNHNAAPESKAVRPSTMGRWRALVLILVHVAIGLHIAHWLTTGSSITPVEPSEASAFSQSSIVNAGLIFFAAMILLTALFGRWFCGWGCHVLALQDLCRHWMLKLGIRPKPLRSRVLMIVPTLAFLYMFIWPIAYRVWIGDSLEVRTVEMTTSHFWATFPGWIIGGLTFLICGFATVYFLGAKGFCTYACPYGAIFAGADRLAPMRIRVTDACMQCGHCTAVCSSNVRVHEEVRDYGMVVSPGCMKCQDCVSVCPKGALYFGFGPIPIAVTPKVDKAKPPKKPALSWREELLLAVAFAVAFVACRGLFGYVPFLMALGSAGIVAFLVLTLWHLRVHPTVDRMGVSLRSGGTLTRTGRGYVIGMIGLGLFTAHALTLQLWQWQALDRYATTLTQQQVLLDQPGQSRPLDETTIEQLRGAIDALTRVDAFSPIRWQGHEARMAWLQVLRGDLAAADHHADAAIDAGELPHEMHQVKAHVAAIRGDQPAAESAWRAAITARPDRPEPYLALGLSLARTNRLERAGSVFAEGLQYLPGHADLRYNAGLARAMLGDVAGAIGQFERTLELQPSHVQARENLAGLFASRGQFAESAAQFEKAVGVNPQDARTRILYGQVLIELGQIEKAREQLQTASKLDPVDTLAAELLRALDDNDRNNR